MSTHARKFTSTSDRITITPTAFLNGCAGFAIHFAFQVDAGATTLSPGAFFTLFSQFDGTAPNDAFYVNYNAPSSGNNNLSMGVTDGESHFLSYETDSSFDPFAGMAGDGLWHYLTLEVNTSDSSYQGTSKLSIDGTTYTSAQWVRTATGDFYHRNLASSSAAFVVGGNVAAPWNGPVGFSVADIGVWVYPSIGRGPDDL